MNPDSLAESDPDTARVDDPSSGLRRPRLGTVAGTCAAVDAAYLLATGRWGSYVGVPHTTIYIGDVLFGAAVLAWVAAGGLRAAWHLRRSPVVLTIAALVAWTVVRLASQSVNTVALRDAAPYVYPVLAVIVLTVDIREVVKRFVIPALVVHAGWVLVAVEAPGWTGGLPRLGSTRVMALRNDFDGMVLGLTIILAFLALLRPQLSALVRMTWVALLVLAAWDMLHLENRAALIATVVCACALIALPVVRRARRTSSTRQKLVIAVAAVAAIAGIALAAAETPAGHRLTSSFSDTSKASGTTRARETAWHDVYDYIVQRPSRVVVGVGFGPDFLAASGGEIISGGRAGVRAPHDILLNTWARLGVIGLALHFLLIVLGLGAALSGLRRFGQRLEVFWPLILIAVPITAMLGVILESPFGAIPYAFGLGYVARMSSARRSLPAGAVVDTPSRFIGGLLVHERQRLTNRGAQNVEFGHD